MLTYDEALDESSTPAPGDYSVSVDGGAGVAPSQVRVRGSTVILTLATPAGPSRPVTVSYSAGASPVRDKAGNEAADLDGQAVTNAITLPLLDAATPPAVDGRSLVLTFDEALATDSEPAASAFTVAVDSVGRTVEAVDIRGREVTLTLAEATVAGETVTVSYAKPASNPLTDPSGNEVAEFDERPVTNHSAGCPSGQPADAFWTACLTLGKLNDIIGFFSTHYGALSDPTFTRRGTAYEIDGIAQFPVRSMVLSFTADPGAALGGWVLQIGGDTYDLGEATVQQGTEHNYDIGAGIGWSAANVGDKVSVSLRSPDTTAPTLQSAAVTRDTLVLAYDEALDEGSTPAPGDYSVSVDGAAGVAPSQVRVRGSAVRLTLATPAGPGRAVTVSYSAGASPVRDKAGNEAADLDGRAVTNATLPALDAARPPAVAARSLVLTFDETLATDSEPAASAFTVAVDSASRTVEAVDIRGREATLTLAEAVIAGEVVTVSYAKPASSPLRDLNGNEVADFDGRPVTNHSAACPSGQPADAFWTACLTLEYVGGTHVGFSGSGYGALSPAAFTRRGVRYEFDALRRGGAGGGEMQFSFTADPGAALNGWALQIGSNIYNLGEAEPVAGGSEPHTYSIADTVRWTAANAGDKVSVSLRDVGVPALRSATVIRHALVLTYDEALDEGSTPAPGDYSVSVDGAAGVAPSQVRVRGSVVRLTLATPAGPGRAVTVSYSAGASPVRDKAGNEAADLDGRAVTNATPPALDAARPPAVAARSLVLTFDEALATDSEPAASAFTVAVDSASRTVEAVDIRGREVYADAGRGDRRGRDRDGVVREAREQPAQGPERQRGGGVRRSAGGQPLDRLPVGPARRRLLDGMPDDRARWREQRRFSRLRRRPLRSDLHP